MMRAHGHVTTWSTQVGVGRIGVHAGWYQPLKAWWEARQAARRQAHLAMRDARWDALQAVRPLRADAALDMAATQGGLTVATMLYGLQQ